MASEEEPLGDFDPFNSTVIAARDAVDKAIRAYITTIRPEENPYVVAWAVGVEWTNTELEQTAHAARDVITLHTQPICASAGLGAYLVRRFD